MTGVMQSSVQAQHQTGNLNQRGELDSTIEAVRLHASLGAYDAAAVVTLTMCATAVPRSVVLFAKALTASDCCTSVSKGGRITIPRVAVEKNLPSVADKRHHEVVRQMQTCQTA